MHSRHSELDAAVSTTHIIHIETCCAHSAWHRAFVWPFISIISEVPFACSCPKLHAYAGPVWHLILYADGITPGGALVPDNRRKSVVFYASFLELRGKLASEEAWITLAIARTCSQCVLTFIP